MIPKIVHTVWIGPNEMPLREQQFLWQIQNSHPSFTHLLWTDKDIQTIGMPPKVRERFDAHYNDKKWAFAADILRLWVVYRMGGIYLDVDFQILQPLELLIPPKGFLCYHPTANPPDYTLVNGVFGSEQGSAWLGYCIDKIDESGWWFGPEWFGRTVKEYLNLPYEIESDVMVDRLQSCGIMCMDWQKFDKYYAKHHALYSWRTQ